MTLAIPDLSMLARFAVMEELQERAGAPGQVQALAQATFRSYASSVASERLESCWPLLRHFAREWVRQRDCS